MRFKFSFMLFLNSFNQVIPPGSMDSSSKYMFKLTGVGSCPSLVATLNAEINTRSGPFDPQFDVSIPFCTIHHITCLTTHLHIKHGFLGQFLCGPTFIVIILNMNQN